MSKFKVGDKVRRLKDSFNSYNMIQGNIYTVSKNFEETALITVEEASPKSEKWNAHYFELVEIKSELQELVDKANAGEMAARQIKNNFLSQVEYSRTGVDYWMNLEHNYIFEYRIKPKKQFIPFKTEEGYVVQVKDNFLHIGCKNFDIKDIKIVLYDFLNNSCLNRSGEEYSACRKGISHNGTTLSWKDCERIYAKLKEIE